MNKNKVIVQGAFGGPEVYDLHEQPIAEPQGSDVRIRILAAGIAYADVLMRRGKYPGMPKTPFIPGYDLIGIVEKCGPKADPDLAGKTVAALTRWGSYGQYINYDSNFVVQAPSEIDPVKGVALVLNYVTAYQAATRKAEIAAGDTILVHGAAGGVGTAILQLAKTINVKTYGTCSKEKFEIVERNGGIPIDYKNEDFEEFVKERETKGIDAFFDFRGGDTYDKSMNLLKKGGRAIVYSFSDAKNVYQIMLWIGKFFVNNLFSGKKTTFYSVADNYKNFLNFDRDLKYLFELLNRNQIDPVIAKRIKLDEVPEAHKDFEAHKFVGKVVIEPNS